MNLNIFEKKNGDDVIIWPKGCHPEDDAMRYEILFLSNGNDSVLMTDNDARLPPKL